MLKLVLSGASWLIGKMPGGAPALVSVVGGLALMFFCSTGIQSCRLDDAQAEARQEREDKEKYQEGYLAESKARRELLLENANLEKTLSDWATEEQARTQAYNDFLRTIEGPQEGEQHADPDADTWLNTPVPARIDRLLRQATGGYGAGSGQGAAAGNIDARPAHSGLVKAKTNRDVLKLALEALKGLFDSNGDKKGLRAWAADNGGAVNGGAGTASPGR